jgi:hypothetical protein
MATSFHSCAAGGGSIIGKVRLDREPRGTETSTNNSLRIVTGNFLRACREFNRPIREIFALIRERGFRFTHCPQSGHEKDHCAYRRPGGLPVSPARRNASAIPPPLAGTRLLPPARVLPGTSGPAVSKSGMESSTSRSRYKQNRAPRSENRKRARGQRAPWHILKGFG